MCYLCDILVRNPIAPDSGRHKGNRIAIQPNTLQTRVFQVNYLASRRQGATELRVTSSAIAGSALPPGATTTPGAGAVSRLMRWRTRSSIRVLTEFSISTHALLRLLGISVDAAESLADPAARQLAEQTDLLQGGVVAPRVRVDNLPVPK